MIQLPTNHVFRRFVGSFVVAQRRSCTAPADSFEIQYKNAPYARGFAAWVVGQETNGRRKNHVVARRRTPLFLWNKSLFLAPLLSVQTQRVASLSCKCHPILRNSAFGPVLIDRDKAKSRRFSKSKSVCAGWSGKVPRLCAIWTPQCGGMKEKLCFIKRKSKDLGSNNRRFGEKNVSIFENGKKGIKTCGLSCETPLLFSSSSLLFLKRRPCLRPPCHALFPHPHLRTRERTRPCTSRTQRVRNSCLHPSPSPAIHSSSVFCA